MQFFTIEEWNDKVDVADVVAKVKLTLQAIPWYYKKFTIMTEHNTSMTDTVLDM